MKYKSTRIPFHETVVTNLAPVLRIELATEKTFLAQSSVSAFVQYPH
jgi:hypothetical protein